MKGKIQYVFLTKMWKHHSPNGWHFISLPQITSKEIREYSGWMEEGWGRMKVHAEIEELRWETAIWFDTKHDTYVLPIKAEIRRKSKLEINNEVKMNVWI